VTRRVKPAVLGDLAERILVAHGARVDRSHPGLLRVNGPSAVGTVSFAVERAALELDPAAHLIAPGSPGFGRLLSLARALRGSVAYVEWRGEAGLSDTLVAEHLRAHAFAAAPFGRRTRVATMLVHHVRATLTNDRTTEAILTLCYDVDAARIAEDEDVPSLDRSSLAPVYAPCDPPSQRTLRGAAEAVRAAVAGRMHRSVRRVAVEQHDATRRRLAALQSYYTDRLREEAARTAGDGATHSRQLKEEWERKSQIERERCAVTATIHALGLEVWRLPRTTITTSQGPALTAVHDHATARWLRLSCERCRGLVGVLVVDGRRTLCRRCAGLPARRGKRT
jgi:hypothetical protein